MEERFPWISIDPIIDAALREDVGTRGDITTRYIIPRTLSGTGHWISRSEGIIAGLPVVERVLHKTDKNLHCRFFIHDGEKVHPGMRLGTVSGSLASILTSERTALNFLQRLSGIASAAHQFAEAVRGTGAVILDTRKTLPSYRWLEKYAVRRGGAQNHRSGLYDMVLIKDNHIDAAGGITVAVNRCMHAMKKKKYAIEVETRTIDEVREAAGLPIDRIMLDNMSLDLMKQAMHEVCGRMEIEASGTVSLQNVRAIAETGVHFISVGSITHSARALDISLDIEQRAAESPPG